MPEKTGQGRAVATQNKKPGALGGLILGLPMLAAPWLWTAATGSAPDGTEQLYLGFFQAMGGLSVLGSGAQFYRAWRAGEERKEAEKPSGVFGEAKFATLEDCAAAGLTDPRGLYLGLLEGQPLFYSGKAHLLTVAPARTGKGIGFVIPNLLHFQGSVFVTDPKGELAAVTAKHRKERFGQDVFFLNPWKLHGLPAHRYNPLAPLLAAASDPALSKGVMDEARALALALVPEPEDTKNKYFRDGARQILRGVMVLLATRGAPGTCTLAEAWRIVTNEGKLKEAIAAMCGSTSLGGVLADIGDDLSRKVAESGAQFQDFRTGAAESLDIFDPSGFLGEAVSGSDLDFTALKDRPTTVYVMIPQDERIATYGAWLGLLSRQAITAVARSSGKTPALFLLDEFANMGRLAGLAESLTALPGLGVRIWAIVQELSEMERIYGPLTAQTLLSQADVKQFFAVQSDRLARTLSAALGQKTVKTRNYNMGKFADDEIGESMSETGRPLLSPDEIRLMGPDEQLLFIKSLPPVRAKRPPFWFVSPWRDWAEPNPVEGEFPSPEPVVTLTYKPKESAGEKAG